MGFNSKNSKQNKILILRPDNLGDLVLYSGALRHIRRHYFQSEITLCTKKYAKNLVEYCPYIDNWVDWDYFSEPLLGWLPDIRGRDRLNWWFRSFKNRFKNRYDIIIQPVRSPTSGIFGIHQVLSTIPAKEKFGISGDHSNLNIQDDQAAESYYTERLNLTPERRFEHELGVNQGFLSFMNIEIGNHNLWPEFWTNETDAQWAKQSIPANKDLITIAICPGYSSNSIKAYPPDRYAEAISHFKKHSFRAVLFGRKSEESVAAETISALQTCSNVKSIINLVGDSTIRQMIEGLKRCDIVLSIDTAALHMGVALHKPTVGIMGGGHHGRFYPWGDQDINRVASKQMDCYGCNWDCIYPTARCVNEISPQIVSDELVQVLIAENLIS